MAQNNNQNGAQTAPTTQSKAIAAMKDELANSVLRRIEELQANGGLVVPKDYAVTNQMNLAWLRISEMLWEDSNKVQHPVLEVVTKASVANSLLDMVLQGMDIQKKQGYFIPIKNKASGQLELTFWRSYFGDEKLARAQGMKKVRSVVVYEGDEFEYMYTEDGEIKITKHVKREYCEQVAKQQRMLSRAYRAIFSHWEPNTIPYTGAGDAAIEPLVKSIANDATSD